MSLACPHGTDLVTGICWMCVSDGRREIDRLRVALAAAEARAQEAEGKLAAVQAEAAEMREALDTIVHSRRPCGQCGRCDPKFLGERFEYCPYSLAQQLLEKFPEK